MDPSLLRTRPASPRGAAWSVVEHLLAVDAAGALTISELNHDQRVVFGLLFLEAEVNSGGFDVYFRYSGGDTVNYALEAAALLGPRWVELLSEAISLFGNDYPYDIDAREAALDRLNLEQPAAIDSLTDRFYDLEADTDVDELMDNYVWSHQNSFFA